MKSEKYHFIGIGGIGMSGLAKILLERGEKVQGSDLSKSNILKELKKKGAKIFFKHDGKVVKQGYKVVHTTAIKKENPEYKAALDGNNPILHRSDLLNDLMIGSLPLLVTGTHGKTTTASLLSTTLMEAGLDPSFVVGGIVNSYWHNARYGKGKYFVAEADESDGSFLKTSAFGAIVTNLEREHIDYWKNEDNLKSGFAKFFDQVMSKEHLFWCKEDKGLCELKPQGISYGFKSECDLYIYNIKSENFSMIFDFSFKGKEYKNVKISLIGKHNVLNAGAVFGLALNLGIDETLIRRALQSFLGVGRRVQLIGEHSRVSFFDDYGHHPTEIKATIAALRGAVKERRIVVVFQPHRYSRTKDLLQEFGDAFDGADLVVVTDIYAAFEDPIEGVDSKVILNEIQKRGRVESLYVAKADIARKLAEMLKPHNVVLFQGAGDITSVGSKSFQFFSKKRHKLKVGLFFGGKSAEHEVSIVSARNVSKCLTSDLYELSIFGLTRQNRWILGENSFDEVAKGEEGEELNPRILKELKSCDLFFPVMHGPFGEDGAIQGFFEILGLPYVGCDFRASAIAMNKAWTKEAVLFHGIATSPFVTFRRSEWREGKEKIVKQIIEKLNFRLYVKAVHLGSSVGIKRVENVEELMGCIEYAFLFDDEILVEQEIRGQEIEFSLLGNDYIEVAIGGEILSGGEFYDYDKKYGDKPMSTKIPANISSEKMIEGQEIAKRVFLAVGGAGMARIDFFLDRDGKFWLNEINPIPGFTAISLYPKMWEASGMSAKDLVDRLVVLALHKKRVKGLHKITPKI